MTNSGGTKNLSIRAARLGYRARFDTAKQYFRLAAAVADLAADSKSHSLLCVLPTPLLAKIVSKVFMLDNKGTWCSHKRPALTKAQENEVLRVCSVIHPPPPVESTLAYDSRSVEEEADIEGLESTAVADSIPSSVQRVDFRFRIAVRKRPLWTREMEAGIYTAPNAHSSQSF